MFAMVRFVSKRSSSSLNLDASSLDDVRAERAAIALSVGLSWPPDRHAKPRGRPSGGGPPEAPASSSTGNALFRTTSSSTTSSDTASACSARPGGDQEKPSTGRSHTRNSPTPRLTVPRQPLQPPHSLKTSPAAVVRSAARSTSTPALATGSSTCWTSGGRERRWDMQRCLCEVQRLCPGMFDGINPNTPYRWKRSASRAETLGRRTLLSPADTTRQSEHIMRVTDVLCLSAVTIRGLVLDGSNGTRRVSQSKTGPATSAFIKLCWLMDKHAVSADRVVKTSCRLLLVHQIGWGRRGVKQAQLQGNTREATTFTVAFSMDRGPLDMLVQIVHAGKTDAVLPEQPWPERTHHVTSENGWATTTTTLLQLAASLDNVLNPGSRRDSRGSFFGTWPASTPARPLWLP